MSLLNFFKKNPIIINITHDMWDNNGKLIINKREHNRGRFPKVHIKSPCVTTSYKFLNPYTIEIDRGLEMWKGTPFTTIITIT